ncbi:auxin-responsive protein SAUR71-like protein [Cinnamomum micranthum f. kanehirae]|uniref:Auxin-responsive protein SAUR71-like protein n=1 Tax=Cinnamomum micranthum f. kanehirae TaxID=337451 RepID=A0A443P4R1_9MAGN|nr:auxin-responsive protein SAUR71-like protein [Cinnamomum micranthum f. kanehirae]
MKQLIRRLSRVSDSSQYFLLRSNSTSTRTPTRTRRSDKKRGRSVGVPEGHLPVYVGEEMERFVVSAELLNHPIFMELLNQSANEYGYEQQGVLRIPCRVLVFERILEMLRDGGDVQHSFSQDFL